MIEGQGVWSLGIISGANFDGLCRRAMAGDPDAERLLLVLPVLLKCLEAHTQPTPRRPPA
jgi:hypothetical protein